MMTTTLTKTSNALTANTIETILENAVAVQR